MNPQKASQRLNKFLAYVLGHSPHEFGLVPDADGWVRLQDLLAALSEEPGWRHVRQAHLQEVLLSLRNPLFQMDEGRVRALAGKVPQTQPPPVPKLVYVCVRTRTYPVILDQGIFPVGGSLLVLSADQDMARRMGKRFGGDILLTVNTSMAMDMGVRFSHAGGSLWISSNIPPDAFSGPPLPERHATGRAKAEKPAQPPTPGSFFPDFLQKPDSGAKVSKGRGKGKKKKGWKEQVRRRRRKKH